jgi:hypothetical protein
LFGLLSEPGGDFPFHRYHDERHDMLVRIVTGSPLPARDKASTPSSRKVMFTVFWDHEGILLTAFQPQGQTVNDDSYCNILRKLRKAIQRKRPGLTGPFVTYLLTYLRI